MIKRMYQCVSTSSYKVFKNLTKQTLFCLIKYHIKGLSCCYLRPHSTDLSLFCQPPFTESHNTLTDTTFSGTITFKRNTVTEYNKTNITELLLLTSKLLHLCKGSFFSLSLLSTGLFLGIVSMNHQPLTNTHTTMVFLISQVNGCTYTLDGNTHTCLMYHPLYADGTQETNRGAYEYVEWDELDEDVLAEADRCDKLLKAEVQL